MSVHTSFKAFKATVVVKRFWMGQQPNDEERQNDKKFCMFTKDRPVFDRYIPLGTTEEIHILVDVAGASYKSGDLLSHSFK